MRIVVPGFDGSADQVRPSIVAIDWRLSSLVFQIATRRVMISPGTTLPAVVSQPVPPPSSEFESHSPGVAVSSPVAAIPVVPVHDEMLEVAPPPSHPSVPLTHWVNNPVLPEARFT